MTPLKDGVDRLWPRVECSGWEEAIALGKQATEPVTFEWGNGCARLSITMGFQKTDGSGPLAVNIRTAK
jgi:hypothetical protein